MDDKARGETNRRDFLKSLTAWGVGMMALRGYAETGTTTGTETLSAAGGEMPRRKLGRTGVEVSILGLGGAHMAGKRDENLVARIVHEAIDGGINFFDNAWEYAGGFAEEAMGKALVGRRDKVFLMSKVCNHGRGKKVALQQLDESLRRLRTDYLDLWQIHEVVREYEPDLHFQAEGVIEALDEAKRSGKVRFVGFTGHKDPAIHLAMLRHKYPFDTCQLPLNCFDASYRSFEKEVLPELERQGIAAIGMKSLGGNAAALKDGLVTAEEALRYAMSLPVATTVSGIDSVQVLRENLRIAREFRPMSPEEMEALRKRCAAHAADGKYEPFKSSGRYDGAVGRQQQELRDKGEFRLNP